ncbi:MAG TPA: WG repeat-containing protein [Flavobacteriales bacterium]|nr:WG repeat-containing protein [Flavobacteriales bacterium]HNI06325.1 WG repeat-containing protein [Flavobacteriales bacterium]HNK40552.1 WG repeat-containing protein [Flavobacteriales bacterium]HNM69632.1 WG repeat-containing protein [Flavobacteriales bacterium]
MTVPTFAGRLEQAFNALSRFDYFKARTLFLKETTRNPAAAWYGLSVITGRTDNPFQQLDSSYLYIQRAGTAWAMATSRQQDRYRRLGVDPAGIHAQMEQVRSLGWDRARTINTAIGYQTYINQFSGSPFIAEAIIARDELAFQEAHAQNTADAYRRFLDMHPDAAQVELATAHMQEATFREAVPNGTLVEYEGFIADHPGSPMVADAYRGIYRSVAPERTPEQLYAFIRRYPKNPYVDEAWRAICEDRTKDLSAASITAFLKDYPDYPFVQELSALYETAGLVLHPFRRNGHWGYIDTLGVERIKAVYDFAEPFHGQQAQVGRDGSVGTVSKAGKEVVPVEYEDVLAFSEGLATVERDGRAGVVDRSGRTIVGLAYDEIGEYSGGLAFAAKDGEFGYLDPDGDVAIPFTFDDAQTFHDGFAVVARNDVFGAIDVSGRIVVPFEYEWIERFGAPLVRARRNGKMGLINEKGEEKLVAEHGYVGPFSQGLALVVDKGRCGYVDTTGAFVIPQRYEMPEGTPPAWGDFQYGLARAMSGGKAGIIDKGGNWVVQPVWADIGPPEARVLTLKKKNRWILADHGGRALGKSDHDAVREFRSGFATVRTGDRYGLVDSTGALVLPVKYPFLGDVSKGLLIAADPESGLLGIISTSGTVRVPFAYDAIEFVDDPLALLGRGEGERITDMRLAYMRISDGRYIWKEEGFDAEH